MVQRLFYSIVFLPLQLLVTMLFLAVDLIRLLGWPWIQKRSGNPRPVSDPTLCSIVVLNWNGRHLLESCLPALLKAVATSRMGKLHQVIVVDNGSEDESVEWLTAHFPEVEVIALAENQGFGEGNNTGVRQASHDIVVLLNNDMIVEEDFLDPLLEPFSDPDVFASSAQLLFPPGRRQEETGNTKGEIRRGYLHLSHQPVQLYHIRRPPLPVLWAGGGSSAFRRDRFLELGGFSSLFSPCYVEDTDMGYRAWRRGWKCVLAARSRILHKHRSSTSLRFDAVKLEPLIEERKLWYFWKNYQLRRLISHFLLLPFHFNRVSGSPQTYLKALRKLGYVLAARLREAPRVYSDAEILDHCDHPLRYLSRLPRIKASSEQKRLRILVVSAYLPHLGTHGGAGRVYQLLRHIARIHDVDLLTFVEGPEEERFLHQVRTVCDRVVTVTRRGFDPLSPFPYEPFEEFNSGTLRQELEQMLLEKDYDLIHFEWTQMVLYADLTPHIPKLATEIEVNYAAHRTVLDIETSLLERVMQYYRTLQTLYREVELCRRVDHVVCVTDKDRDYLTDYVAPDKISIINTGVDAGYFEFSPDSSRSGQLLFVGAFRHSPNVDAMLFFCRDVFPLIRRRHPQAKLTIAGSAPPPQIRQLASRSGIEVTGFVDDIRPYYEEAQVVVVPLRTGVGIRGKILEAWAVGRATVATSLACQGLRTRHGENIYIADSAEEMALWTSALLSDPQRCRQVGRRARQVVEKHYHWPILGHRLVELYNDVRTIGQGVEP